MTGSSSGSRTCWALECETQQLLLVNPTASPVASLVAYIVSSLFFFQNFVSLYMQERNVEFSFINIASVQIRYIYTDAVVTRYSGLKMSWTGCPETQKTTQK